MGTTAPIRATHKAAYSRTNAMWRLSLVLHLHMDARFAAVLMFMLKRVENSSLVSLKLAQHLAVCVCIVGNSLDSSAIAVPLMWREHA